MSNEYDALVQQAPEAQAKAITNEYDGVIVELDKAREQRARASILSAQDANPDQTAKALALSKKTGVPVETVERDVKAVEGPLAVNEYDALVKKSPGLGKWLEEPINARLAKDDYENLGLLEKFWNEVKRGFLNQRTGVQALGASVAGQRMADIEAAKAKAANGEYLSPIERAWVANEAEGRKTLEASSGASIGKLLENKKAADEIPMHPALREMNEAKTWGEAWGAFAKAPLSIIYSLTAQNAPTLVGTVAATVAGGPVAGVTFAGGTSFTQEFVNGILDNMQELGVDTSSPDALKTAFADKDLMAEVYRKSTIKASIVGTLDAATMGIAGKTIAPSAVKSRVAREAFNIPAQLAIQMAGGAGGEAIGSVAAGNEIKPGAVLAEAAGELGGAPAEIATMRGAVKADQKQAKIERFNAMPPEQQAAVQTAAAIDKLVENAQTTKLAGRSPEKLEEFLASVAGPDQNVFVPADVVQTYLQSKPLEDMQRFADALGISEQLPEALARGGDVVIPLAKYVTEAGKSDAHKAWLNDLRLEVDGLSVRQAEEDAKTAKERTKLAVERFEAQLEAGIAEVDATTRVYEDMRDKLRTMGQYTNEAAEQQAALFAERYAARAARNPNRYADAWEAYAQAGTGKGLDIQTVLSDRVRAMPADNLDLLLNSIRSGKAAPTKGDADANAQFQKDRTELSDALKSMGIDTGKLTNAQIRKAIKEAVEKKRAGLTFDQPTKSLDAVRAEWQAAGIDEFVSEKGDTITLHQIIVPKESRGRGTGTTAMQSLVAYADSAGKRIVLSPSSDFGGNKARLVKFYKAFGFENNKGRNKDFRFRETMIRRPKETYEQSANPQTDTPAFKKWFGKSKVVDAKGEPLRVYHGTTADFDTFDRGRGNAESDLGAGFYFSGNPADVGENYAGVGPDLTNKLERTAERIAGETDREYNDPDVVAEARARFVAHDGATMPVYLRMENPVEIGGKNETRLTYEEKRDADDEPTGEEVGTLVDFVMNLRNIAEGFHDGEVDGVIGRLVEEAMDGEISASKAMQIIKDDEQFGYYTDDNGDMASNEIVRQAFEAAGFDGYIDRTVNVKFGSERRTGKKMAGMNKGTVHYVAFDPEQIKSATGNRGTFDPNDPSILNQEARGQISFTDNRTIISLFQSRDLSTLIHEGGHLFLAELEFDAKATDAPEQITKDWQAVLDWLGSKDGYITRDMHEQFARGFETYVMEGKAPSSALASAFRSFKRWLTQIYKRLSALDSPLTPEVREVFDRLVATDEQIASAQTKQGLNPVFTDAKSAGMTEAEFAAYTARANAVVEEAEQRLLQKTMDTIRKQRTKEWKADEKAVREEVTQEVMSESGQQALALLTKGEFPVGTTPEVMKGVKLAKESVVELYGDESILTLLPAGIYRDRASGPGVVSPDELAPMLGLGSGRELIERLTQLEAEKRALAAKGDNRSVAKARIDEETAGRMRERYGDPLNDGTIEQEAMAAVHSDKQAALMATELRVLARKAGHTGTVTLDDIQTWAAQSIADKKVRDGTRSEQYARAERDAGKRVERALMKGNFVEAFKAKQDQLVNLALYRESQKAAADVEAARKLMDRYASADTIKSMDQEYLEQIHQLLENYEFKRRSDKFLEGRDSFEAWAIKQEAMGIEVIAPPRYQGGLGVVNYRDMTVDELRGLTDTVKQIAHLGRFKKEMLDGQKKREFEAVIAEAVASVQAIPQRGVSQVRRGMTNLQAKMGDVGSWFRSADAALLKLETVFEWLDGDKTGRGVFQRVIFQRMAEAQTVERDLQKKLNTQLTAIHEKVPLEQRKRWTDVLTLPELGTKLNRSQLIAVALNIGNEGNLDKLLRGEKWDEKSVRAVLDKHLTKEEWQFVQDSWDLVNSLWPEVEAMERRVNGVAPPKVEALEVPTPFGTLKGGYYPAVYDTKASVEGDKIGAMKAEGLFDPAYRKATTRAGSTRKRTGAAYPMLLSLQVIGQHLNEVSHDIAFREAVIDAYRFLTDKRIKEAVNEALGPEYSAQFEPWVKHIANEWAIDRKGTQDIEKFMDGLRTNVTVVGMGFRASTMFSQVAGYANSIQRLGTIGMASGMRAFLKNPAEAVRTVHAKSGEMRHRMNDLERDIRAALQKIEGKSGFKSDAQRFAFRGIALFDAAVTIPTWLGAHTKGLKDGMTDKEASAYADKMVRDTQGSGAAKDLAAIQRGGPLMKLFTMFYSYFNVFYNRQRSLARDVREVRSVGQGMDALAQSFWLLVVPALLAPLLAGQGPGDDEELGNWVARNLFFGLFSGLPYVRDAANTANNMAGGKGNFGGTKLSPVQTVWDTAFHTGKDVARLIEGEDVSETAIKSVFNTAGLVLGLPTGQLGATTQFLWDALISGSQDPQTLKDWLDGLTYGPERKK